MDGCDFSKIHKLACLEETTMIDDTVREVRELIGLIHSLDIPENYPAWSGVQGPKSTNDDSTESWNGAKMAKLASQNSDGFVLTTKVV